MNMKKSGEPPHTISRGQESPTANFVGSGKPDSKFRGALSCGTNCINRITNFSPMSNNDIGEIAYMTASDVSKKCIIYYI